MIEKLADLLNVVPGEMFNSLVTLKKNSFLSKEPWPNDNKSTIIYKNVINNVFTVEPIGATYFNDTVVVNLLLEKKFVANKTSKRILRNNCTTFANLKSRGEYVEFSERRPIGMSLGETIVCDFPQAHNIYRNDFEHVIALHRILHDKRVFWMHLESTEGYFSKFADEDTIKNVKLVVT